MLGPKFYKDIEMGLEWGSMVLQLWHPLTAPSDPSSHPDGVNSFSKKRNREKYHESSQHARLVHQNVQQKKKKKRFGGTVRQIASALHASKYSSTQSNFILYDLYI